MIRILGQQVKKIDLIIKKHERWVKLKIYVQLIGQVTIDYKFSIFYNAFSKFYQIKKLNRFSFISGSFPVIKSGAHTPPPLNYFFHIWRKKNCVILLG